MAVLVGVLVYVGSEVAVRVAVPEWVPVRVGDRLGVVVRLGVQGQRSADLRRADALMVPCNPSQA